MGYDVKPLHAQRLAGPALRLFAATVETPGVGAPLRRAMLRAAGIPDFRAIPCDDPSVVVPPLPVATQDAPSAAPQIIAPPDGNVFTAAHRAGETTPDEVAERFLEAVAASDRGDTPLRAFIATDAGDLRAQARAATLRYREGRPLGPLDGVPIAVKDELDQAPYPTTAGTSFLGRRPAESDATSVARLRAAGALLVGKTNMQEAGMGVTGINPHHGTPRNPHDPSRVAGGSSSGSAAAVAAGLCPIAISADAGGSIRIPAALCGVVGLKPTFGRVSERGAVQLGWSCAHVGVVGATARDVSLAYAAIAGTDPLAPNTAGQPAPVSPAMDATDVAGLRIGVYSPWFNDAEPEVVRVCRAALDALRGAGAEVIEIDLPDLHLVRPTHFVTVALEWTAAYASRHEARLRQFGPDVRLVKALAESLRPTDYVHAQRLRRRVCDRFAGALAEVDVIATPTTGLVAPRLPPDAVAAGESDFTLLDRMSRFVTAANLTGHPAISIPAGHDPTGLPVGLQLIARPWREDVLLCVAAIAERLIRRTPPKVRYELLTNSVVA
jgi:Asp-tRNA(Asn)/Glu-tRNA(Gln) amidotransferase A subunit family amidase